MVGDTLTLHEREVDTALTWVLDGTTLKLDGTLFPFRADSLNRSSDDSTCQVVDPRRQAIVFAIADPSLRRRQPPPRHAMEPVPS